MRPVPAVDNARAWIVAEAACSADVSQRLPIAGSEHSPRAQWRQPFSDSLALALRADYRHVGRTWWEPYNVTSRDPIDRIVRLGGEDLRVIGTMDRIGAILGQEQE